MAYAEEARSAGPQQNCLPVGDRSFINGGGDRSKFWRILNFSYTLLPGAKNVITRFSSHLYDITFTFLFTGYSPSTINEQSLIIRQERKQVLEGRSPRETPYLIPYMRSGAGTFTDKTQVFFRFANNDALARFFASH